MAQALTDAQVDIAAVMKMIEAEVMKLAPEPGGQRGFIYAKSDARVADSGDDMLGGMIADAMITVATGGAFSSLGGVDVGHVVDAVDEVYVDRAKSKQAKSRAFQTAFDSARLGSRSEALKQAFERDLPKRVQLERQYMVLARKLDEANEPEFNFDLKREMNPDLALERHHKMGAY